ncbi:hypothetical protein MRI28_18755 [Nocardiopsis dassonvillei]|uniref:hypothetical protein n=1 Tax=Nocardiopsis dassonvillei TaxID=2014 RepID=UPI00200BB9E7|nr:hypothetical protein [Nocardiopsis dassonvillei]MCK9871652.1 hypothetical protein [Nocardiopsis dassonvillei]
MGTDRADQGARAALPPGLRPMLDTLHPAPTFERTDQPDPGLNELRAHLAHRAPNTRRAYLNDWQRWTAWCRANHRTPLPATPDDVALYLAHAHDTHKATPTTLQRWASTLATAHTATGHPDPTRQPPATTLLTWARAAATRPKRRTSRWLTTTEFDRVLATTHTTAWPDTVIAHRDRLILLLARTIGEGPDTILDLRTGQLTLDATGTHLTPRTGQPRLLTEPLDTPAPRTCLACSLVQWRALLDAPDTDQLRHSATTGAPRDDHLPHRLAPPTDPDRWLLRRVRRGGNITADRMAPDAIRTLLRARAQQAEVDTAGLTAFALRSHP